MQDAGAFSTPPLFCQAKVLLKDIIFPTKSNRILHVEFVVTTLLSTNTQSHRHHVAFPSRTSYAPLSPFPAPFLQISTSFYFHLSQPEPKVTFAPSMTVSFVLRVRLPLLVSVFWLLLPRTAMDVYRDIFSCAFSSCRSTFPV